MGRCDAWPPEPGCRVAWHTEVADPRERPRDRCAQPVDDLCKKTVILWVMWGNKTVDLRGGAMPRIITWWNSIHILCTNEIATSRERSARQINMLKIYRMFIIL